MNRTQFIDYTLDATAPKEEASSEAPTVSAVLALEVDSAEVRCMKGDCNQDYAPG